MSKLLLENGASLDVPDSNGVNCLRIAANSCHLEIINFLIENRFVNISDFLIDSAIFNSIFTSQLLIVILLFF